MANYWTVTIDKCDKPVSWTWRRMQEKTLEIWPRPEYRILLLWVVW
jgi:hypothetical protein